jgi:peptidyl-prolyl cis-trans isomerase SurA
MKTVFQFRWGGFAALALLCAGTGAAAQSNRNGIAAVVDGKVITFSEVREAVRMQEGVMRMQMRDDPMGLRKALDELNSGAVDSLIERELILNEFTKIGGTIKPQYVDDSINDLVRDNFDGNRDAFVSELARAGITMKKFREQQEKMIIVQVMRGRYANQPLPPTPLEVREYYEKNIERFRDNDMIKISTISIPKFVAGEDRSVGSQRRLAEDIRAKVLAGANFAETARTHSIDSRSDDGGEWPWMERTQMKKSIADAAFATREGGVSNVIEDETVFILVAVDAKKLGRAEPLENVRMQIERMIRQEKSKAALDSWIESLKRKASIRRYDKQPGAT